MKNLSKPLVLTLIVLVLLIAVPAVEVLRFGGAFRTTDSEFAGNCRAVDLAGSSEDIQIDRERGIAYLSYLDRARFYAGEAVGGSVMLLDLNLPDPAPRAAMSFDPANFHPHGISLWQQPGQASRLFAISHVSPVDEAVEIAELGSSGFVPKATIRDASFAHPNAIAAVGPNQFYLVNDHPRQSEKQLLMTALLRSRNGSLVYFDGERGRALITDLQYPVGIALSPDRSRIYVAEATGKALRVYRRDPADGVPALEEVVDLGTSPDNLNVDPDGVVWIAAHPRLLKFAAHARHPEKRAPTQVLRFDPKAKEPRLRQVYMNDGAQIAAGSVAAPWRGEFLIGAVLDKKVLVCKPNP